MHDQVLAMSSHCDALDLSAVMLGVGGGAEGGRKQISLLLLLLRWYVRTQRSATGSAACRST